MRSSKSSNRHKLPSAKQFSWQFESIGTAWSIDIRGSLAEAEAANLRADVTARIEQFDKAYSRFRPDSLVSQMAESAGTYQLPDDARPLLDLYERLYELTGGAVTPMIGNTLSDAGYDAQYSLKPKELHKPPGWNEALDYDFPKLTVKQPVLLDFGGAGKGYLVDIIAGLLRQRGQTEFSVNAGGDIYFGTDSSKPLKVGLENPDDFSEAVGIAEIRNQSICGSAGNRRRWGEYNHLLDPVSLKSPQYIKAVWAVAASGLLADGLTTALYFSPSERLQQHFQFEFVIINMDNTFNISEEFPGELFTNTQKEETV